MPGQTFGIFCRTYHKDADRLHYTLRSIERFCTGFNKVVVACPSSSLEAIRAVVGEFAFAEVRECQGWPQDFIGQQITKLTANRFIDTDIIVHIDSDCIFVTPTTPDDLMRDGSPILLHAPYSYFYTHGENSPWQTVTSHFMRMQVDLEFMRSFPLTYPRELYEDVASWYEEVHGEPIEKVYDRIYGDYFSEFNLLGAFSFYRAKRRAYNSHVNVLKETTINRVEQFCLFNSRVERGIADAEREHIEAILGSPTGADAKLIEQAEAAANRTDLYNHVPINGKEVFVSKTGSLAVEGEAVQDPILELEAFKRAELWDGGFVDADPLPPLAWSSYSTAGFISVYHAIYLACIKPYLRPDATVMEIGPGRGVWTRALLGRGASIVYALDVQSREQNKIDEVVGTAIDRLQYLVVSDFEAEAVPDNGIDFFWTFGTFVHLSKAAQASYIRTIFRKMKSGAFGFIQFADMDVWNRVVTDRSLHIHQLIADKLGGEVGELSRQAMSESDVIAPREEITEWHRHDETVHPGRYFFVGTSWLAKELENVGFKVCEENILSSLRDPVIHFQKP